MMATSRRERSRNYESLRNRVQEIKSTEDKSIGPSDRERADWAYGNTKIENEAITRQMAEQAVKRRKSRAR